MTENILEAERITKSYAEVQAVKGISFSVARGSLFSFLGENGAGKSTTINIICGILKQDSGKVIFEGKDLDAFAAVLRPKIGVVFQHSILDDLLTVRDNLTVRASFYRLKGREWNARMEELCKLFDIKGLLGRQFGKLSGGERRRVDIARALINRPSMLILDEPTTGLDPQTRRDVWQVLGDLRREEGTTVFLTTHYMEEADGSDLVVILDQGSIAARGTPAELKNKYTHGVLKLYGETAFLTERLRSLGVCFSEVAGAVRIADDRPGLVQNLLRQETELFRDFEYTKGTMDDVFLAVTGKTLQGGNIV